MGWPLKERRGQQGWSLNTVSSSSISAPPLQLVSIVAIVIFLLFLPSYLKFKSTVHKATVNFHLFRLILPLLLIFIAYFISRCGSRQLVLPVMLFGRVGTGTGTGTSPWGVGMLVVLLLVLASYLSHFRSSMWSPLIWRPH